AGDQFGFAVTAVGSTVLIGAPGAGRAFLFDGTSGALLRTLAAPTPEAGDQFGYAVAALGSNLLVGAPGAGDLGASPNAGRAFLLDRRAGALLQIFATPTPAGGARRGATRAGPAADRG